MNTRQENVDKKGDAEPSVRRVYKKRSGRKKVGPQIIERGGVKRSDYWSCRAGVGQVKCECRAADKTQPRANVLVAQELCK